MPKSKTESSATVPSLAPSSMAAILRWHFKLALTRTRLRAAMLAGRRPTVTYATYRTSSTSTHWALRRAVGGASIKAHTLLPSRLVHRSNERWFPETDRMIPLSSHIGDWAVSSEIVLPRRPANFVVVIRDPVAVAISGFAIGWQAWLPRELAGITWPDDGNAPAPILERLASAIFDEHFYWHLMPDWMDHDLRPALGWDWRSLPFPHDRGHATAVHGPWKILVLRSDVPDAQKAPVLAEFTGASGIEVRRDNTATDRAVPGLLAAAGRAARLRPERINELLDGEFARHFWSADQLQAMRSRWLGQ